MIAMVILKQRAIPNGYAMPLLDYYSFMMKQTTKYRSPEKKQALH